LKENRIGKFFKEISRIHSTRLWDQWPLKEQINRA
jgi:hypothetical protein